ncbi:hypothetical protein ZEAMMB73_Zm00001d040029 [Zea mays]|uniref:Bowman-Birk serine protease inhibitors family domain-containing protein n=1 Tax=Zea mays TaxID=4577 RepID=A0A1D6MMA1_MAIZE|nr:hypothetical protein ZEAMMB73_Zm00001d040029 [Zea mays]
MCAGCDEIKQVRIMLLRAGPTTKKQCWCGECTSWSGVWTCDDLLTKCAATCKNCVPVSTDKGAIKYRCRDFLPENCGCKIH